MNASVPAPSPSRVRRVFKRCACGISYTFKEWCSLTLCGYLDVPADFEGPAERLQLRNCRRCDSTLAVNVGVSP